MRGRKPKPSYLRVLEGGAAKVPDNEPVPAGKLEDLPPPEHLNDGMKAIWREALASAPKGLLRNLDTYVFEQWVTHAFNFREASRRVASLGTMLKSKDGTAYQNPYLSIMNRQSKEMRGLAADLGFTPSSRARVKIDPSIPSSSPFADLKTISDD